MSNPDTLNNYLGVLGVNSELISFSEVVSLDAESIAYLPQPIVGAIFVYPDSKHINNYFFGLGESIFQKKAPEGLYLHSHNNPIDTT